MKLIKLVNAVENLNKLCEAELPAKESFKLIKLIQQIEPELQNYHTQRNKLLAKYGESDDGNKYTITEDNKDGFLKEIQDLEEIEIDLNFEKINISNIAIKPINLMSILDFVEGE